MDIYITCEVITPRNLVLFLRGCRTFPAPTPHHSFIFYCFLWLSFVVFWLSIFMMWCFCPRELCSRNHRTKSPSRMLSDLLEKGRTHSRQPSSSSGFLPHLALWRGTGAEAMARRGAVPSLSRPSFPQSHSCSELGWWEGGPLYLLEGTVSTRTTAVLFCLGRLPSQTHFTFTPRNHRKRSTCTRKLALPHGISQADQWPVPYLAWLQVWWLTQPGTVSVLYCSYLEQLTCVLTVY